MDKLMLHCGAALVEKEELDEFEPPEGTDTWFPIKHSHVLHKVEVGLQHAGFQIKSTKLAISQRGAEFFGTLRLNTDIGGVEDLTVGIRNSNNKKFPLGFCVGRTCFVCDNLAFSSDIVISKRHTRNGQDRYAEGIAHAIKQLHQYQTAETSRITCLRERTLSQTEADSLMLRSAEQDIIGWRALPKVIAEWRNPRHEEFAERNAYCLLQAFTEGMKESFLSQPNKTAFKTIELQNLLVKA